MGWFLGWCVLAGFLTALLTRLLKRAPYHGVPPDATRFFVRLQETLAQRHPAVSIVGLTAQGFGAVLRVDRQELAVPLGEVFLRERAFPSAFPETVDRLVTEIRDHLAAIDDVAFDEAVQRILPQIRTETWIRNHSPAFGPGRILTTELFDDLVICYVLDEPGSMVFVTEGHRDAWGCRQNDLENLAMQNLRVLAQDEVGTLIPAPNDGTPRVLHKGDGYDAARVLLAMDKSQTADTTGLVFAIPDRDTLVIGRNRTELASLMGDVGQEYERSEYPISPKLYAIGASGLEVVSGE